MAESNLQGLAPRREPRIRKTTKRAQQLRKFTRDFLATADSESKLLVEEQKKRVTREKKSKGGAAKVASQPPLVDDKGIEFMYGPAESYAPPTLTGGT